MSRDRRDGLADGTVSVPPVRSDDETTPLGVKLFCAVGVLLGISHVTFLTEAVATGRLEALVVFTAFGVLCGWLLYGLWTRRRWAWVGTMCWFALIGTLSIATIQYGHAAICFLLLAYLDSVEETFEDSSGYYT